MNNITLSQPSLTQQLKLPSSYIATPLEQLYVNYESVIYGIICTLTDNKEIAKKILINAFPEIKEKKRFEKPNDLMFGTLLRHFYVDAVSSFKKNNSKANESNKIFENRLIFHLLTQYSIIKHAALFLHISEEEVKYKLHIEFWNFVIKRL